FFAVGTTTVNVVATDVHGKTAEASFTVTVVDAQAPVIATLSNIKVDADAGKCGAAVSFNPTATDNCELASVVSTPASGSLFAVGTTTVNVVATDVNGKTAEATFTVTVVDDQAPVIGSLSNLTVDAEAGKCGAAVSFDLPATDNCALASVVSTPASGSLFPIGTTTVHVLATDVNGKTAEASFTVTVVDNQAPVMAGATNMTVDNDLGKAGAAVSFAPTASDNCSVASMACTPASGSFFPVGTTTVNVLATDVHGKTAEATFTV